MEINEEKRNGVSVLRLSGRLDAVSSAEAANALEAALDAGNGVVVSMEGLDYISSSGLRVLLKTAKRAHSEKKGFCLASLGESVREVFDVSGFSALLDIAETEDDALKIVEDETHGN